MESDYRLPLVERVEARIERSLFLANRIERLRQLALTLATEREMLRAQRARAVRITEADRLGLRETGHIWCE